MVKCTACVVWIVFWVSRSPPLHHVRHHQLGHEEGRRHVDRQDLRRKDPTSTETNAGRRKASHSRSNNSSGFSKVIPVGTYLVPHVLCGLHDVSEERVDRRVGYQNVNAAALIQGLAQTPGDTINVLSHMNPLTTMAAQPRGPTVWSSFSRSSALPTLQVVPVTWMLWLCSSATALSTLACRRLLTTTWAPLFPRA